MIPNLKTFSRYGIRIFFAVCFSLAFHAGLAQAEIQIDPIPEMEPFESWSEARSARSAGQPSPIEIDDSLLEAVLHQLESIEPDIRDINLQSLSRWSVTEMEGYDLPEGFVSGLRLMTSHVRGDGNLILDFRGPRLPSNYDIVFRYIHLFVTVESGTQAVRKVETTIQIYREE